MYEHCPTKIYVCMYVLYRHRVQHWRNVFRYFLPFEQGESFLDVNYYKLHAVGTITEQKHYMM